MPLTRSLGVSASSPRSAASSGAVLWQPPPHSPRDLPLLEGFARTLAGSGRGAPRDRVPPSLLVRCDEVAACLAAHYLGAGDLGRLAPAALGPGDHGSRLPPPARPAADLRLGLRRRPGSAPGQRRCVAGKAGRGSEVHVYFDNTMPGAAPADAVRLLALLGDWKPGPQRVPSCGATRCCRAGRCCGPLHRAPRPPLPPGWAASAARAPARTLPGALTIPPPGAAASTRSQGDSHDRGRADHRRGPRHRGGPCALAAAREGYAAGVNYRRRRRRRRRAWSSELCGRRARGGGAGRRRRPCRGGATVRRGGRPRSGGSPRSSTTRASPGGSRASSTSTSRRCDT